MNNNIIIQARVKDALITYGNGDYETRFSTPIKIEQGDQLTIKNCFIDQSVANEDHLNIPFDLTLNISNYVYVRDWVDSPFVVRFKEINTNPVYLNNDIYFLSYRANTTNDSIFLTNYVIRRVGETKLKTWGGFNFTLKFYPVGSYGDDSKILTRTISVPTLNVESNQDKATLPLNITIAGPRTPENPLITGFPDSVVLDTIEEEIVASGQTLLTPQTFTGSYTLLAGDYSPTNLASSISQLLVNNFAVYPQLNGNIVNSQFLKQSSQIPSNFFDDFDPQTGESLQRTQIFLKGDGTIMNQYVL